MADPLTSVMSRDALAPVFPGTVRPGRGPGDANVPTAAASGVRHAGEPLSRTGVLNLFDVLVDSGEAGRTGGFALVVGVDRTSGRGTTDRLLRHGADIVVRDLRELLVSGMSR
ncbi:hypothetical protein ACIP2Y_39410 [Streptomyces sviceus]|uniref:hypothetical protein n=1 Tax=Streptomyces sviceus TaxID=285530 RepID=UPI0037F451FE